MKTEQEWIGFLMKPENIGCALDVGEHYLNVKSAILNRVYEQVTEGVGKHLVRTKASSTWSYYHDNASDPWASIVVHPNDLPDGCPCVVVRLENCVHQGKNRLTLGAHAPTNFADLQQTTVVPLVDALEKRDFCLSHRAWVRRRWLEFYPSEHEFCVEAVSSQRIQTDLTTAMTEFIDQFRKLMEAVNASERARFETR